MNKENINLKKEITTIKGETYPMTYPSKSDIDKIKQSKGTESENVEDVLFDELPRETVQNVILNSIAGYDPEEKKEVFMVSQLASWVMNDIKEDGTAEKLNENLFNFLVDKVLPYCTVMSTDTESKKDTKRGEGIYFAWVMAQVYQELGINK